MTSTHKQRINRLAEKKFDLGQQIINAACRTKHANPHAQELVDQYLKLEKMIRDVLDEACKV